MNSPQEIMFNKLKQIKDLRSQAKTMQDALSQVMVVGKSHGGKIMVTLDGNQKMQGIEIDESVDRDQIAEGVKIAFNDAIKHLQKELAHKMKDMGGLDAFKDLLG